VLKELGNCRPKSHKKRITLIFDANNFENLDSMDKFLENVF
jgi:hypothetical protein